VSGRVRRRIEHGSISIFRPERRIWEARTDHISAGPTGWILQTSSAISRGGDDTGSGRREAWSGHRCGGMIRSRPVIQRTADATPISVRIFVIWLIHGFLKHLRDGPFLQLWRRLPRPGSKPVTRSSPRSLSTCSTSYEGGVDNAESRPPLPMTTPEIEKNWSTRPSAASRLRSGP
jgi:hypothetical protein